MKVLGVFLLIIASAWAANATITLDAPYANGMILPSKSKVNMCFVSDSERPVIVTPSWASPTTLRPQRGRQFVSLRTKNAGGPYSISINDGTTTKTISDIYFGKVILLAGQSNAEMPMYLPNSGYPLIPEGQAEYNSGLYPQIRFCRIQQTRTTTPQVNPPLPTFWEKGDTIERARASAIGWRAAKKLHLQTGEPVGVLSITYGGTPIEQWIPRKLLETLPYGQQQLGYPSNELWCQAYNAMTYPHRNFAVNTIIWYQGEGNVWTYDTYATRLPALMSYLQDEFSIPGQVAKLYIIEIAPFTGYGNLGSPYIRMEESMSAEALGGKLVQTSDLTTHIDNVHTIDKFPVGDRIGNWMINDYYEQPSPSQFRISNYTVLGNQVLLDFSGAGSGITMSRPDGFWVVTSTGTIVPATATITGTTITVSAPSVSNPVGARYGWDNAFMCSTFNSAGIPLSIYATDGIH